MLVVGVTCTLSSRSFLLFRLSLGQVQCFDLLRCRVSATFESRHHSLSIGYRSSLSLSMSPRYRHCLSNSSPGPRSHPLRDSPDLWLLFGFSVLPLVSFNLSAICYVLSVYPVSRRNLVFSRITVYSYLGISFFAFDIRCPCSPTCIFVPSLGPFYRCSTLLSILSPRLIPDFLCPSQLLPFFNLYGLILARLFGF